ncbi:hypothetical protein F2Q69_00043398 [Brassica cretica]|uniref:Putative plant transposon protein domain-containing protein n=1 Tax=Brassica cretica TaxID=69181 RepID=A0A8S9NRZ3_BRACR|nr:hypothetical protein F2Q69_00043398 [Brassica cretica]
MIHHHRSFDFGQMVYDQIISFAANINTDRSRRIIFLTLIQQVIDYQRTVLSFEDDEEYNGYPKLVVKDKKAGRGQGADSRSVDLLADIERTIADLKSIWIRLRRGEYPQYPRQTPQDEEEDEVELDSEEKDHDYLAADIDRVCSFLTDNRVQRWEAMSSKYLTPTNQVLYKLVCSNWIPTTNYTSMNQERLKFLYMIHHHRSFDFGQMVYDQIISFAANINTDRSRRIIFPTLIQQVIDYQRIVLSFEDDEEYTGYPKLVVKDKKAGRGQGADSRSVNLLADIERTISDLKSIWIRLRRGEYPQYPRQTPQDEEEDEVELDSEESESF